MDFLNHLLDAPVSNVLIVAGLLFLGVAAVGKIAGKIEPDKAGRIASGLLGAVLLVAGISTHVAHDAKPPTPVQPVIRFAVIPTHIARGDKVKVTWQVQNADNVELDPFGMVAVSGSAIDEPYHTTIYKLSATNVSGGKQGTFQEVFVDPRPETAHEAKRPLRSPTPAAPTLQPTLGSVNGAYPNFSGTWELTEVIFPPGMKGKYPSEVTIIQSGKRLEVESKEGSLHFSSTVAADGTAVQEEFFNATNQRVATQADATVIRQQRLRLDGDVLVREFVVITKIPGQPLSRNVETFRYRRA